MIFAFISGFRFPGSPEFPFADQVRFLKNFGVESLEFTYETIPPDLMCDCIVGHSFGADKALEFFNRTKINQCKACLCLDLVDKEAMIGGVTIIWPRAKRTGVKSLHDPIAIYPRSAGVKNSMDELLRCSHGDFPNHMRTTELLVRYASGLGWN